MVYSNIDAPKLWCKRVYQRDGEQDETANARASQGLASRYYAMELLSCRRKYAVPCVREASATDLAVMFFAVTPRSSEGTDNS